MKRIISAFAIAAALALPQGAFAQCSVTGSELEPGITAQLYSNVIEVVAPNGAGCYVTVRVKSPEGDVLAEQSVELPDTLSDNWTCSYASTPDWVCYDNSGSWTCDISGINTGRICTGDDDWRHGYSALFLTDWSEKAEFFGIQPGQQIEVETDALPFAPNAVGISAPGPALHTVAEIGLTKLAPVEDVVEGYVHPRMGDRVVASFLGLDMNAVMPVAAAPGSPICLGMEMPLAADGAFAEDFSGECNLLRNGAMLIEYYKKNFRIYRFEHIPGVAAIIDTPFALHSGQMFVPYRAHLTKANGTHKAWATSQPTAWLNLGLFQFSRHQSALPLRKGDKLHVGEFAPYGNGIEGADFQERVPKFGFTLGPPPAPAITNGAEQFAYLTIPEGKAACIAMLWGGSWEFDCFLPGTEDRAAVGTPTKITLGPAPDAMVGIMQKANGNFYIAHKGLQYPLNTLLTETPILPSMYGFIPWLFCEAIDLGICPVGVTTETPRLVRAELAGFLKK